MMLAAIRLEADAVISSSDIAPASPPSFTPGLRHFRRYAQLRCFRHFVIAMLILMPLPFFECFSLISLPLTDGLSASLYFALHFRVTSCRY